MVRRKIKLPFLLFKEGYQGPINKELLDSQLSEIEQGELIITTDSKKATLSTLIDSENNIIENFISEKVLEEKLSNFEFDIENISRGVQGYQGPIGPRGYQGNQGPLGPQGKGEKGETG